ncbi:hypothetical protein ACFCY8_10585 [Streptomyces noursei]|uniref:hypothetical protein n=1 Tax=Streptomyces noursei TaxID=1971 RepID=UPI0035DEF509
MSYQAGTALYAFVVDRLDERMREQYPDGMAAHQDDWLAAHALAQAHAEAVSSGNEGEADEFLRQLRFMAEAWSGHRDHPDRAAA